MRKNDMILRTSFGVRLCHWVMVVCFFLVAATGLSWLFPSFSWLGGVLGTPQMARALHPFLGILVFLFLIYLFVHLVGSNLYQRNDLIWAKNVAKVLRNEHAENLRVGRYNLGQKFLFWGIMGLICALLLTGLMIWRAYFAQYFPIPLLRLALLAHSLAGLALILLVIGHIYLAIWVRGSITGMITGYVSRAWAKTHHDGWYAEVVAREDRDDLNARSK